MKINLRARHKARELALQALYQWQISQQNIHDVEQQFLMHAESKRIDTEYFQALLKGIAHEIDELDALFAPHLHIPIEEIDAIELSILRLGTFELKHHLEIPYKVVINEALELTKTFGSVEGFKFINGVIDKTAQDVRSVEIDLERKSG